MLNGPKHLWNHDNATVYMTSHVPCGWDLGQYFSRQVNLGLVLVFLQDFFSCGLEAKSSPQISLRWNKCHYFQLYFGKRQTPVLFEEGPKGPLLKATASWGFFPLHFPFSLSTLLQFPGQPWAAFITLVNHSPSSVSLSAEGRYCFPMGGLGIQMPLTNATGTWGRENPWNIQSCPIVSSPSSSSLDMVLPPPAHQWVLSPKDHCLELSHLLYLLLFPKLERLPATSVALSAGKGGNNSPTLHHKTFWDPCLTNAISKGWGIWEAKGERGRQGLWYIY